MKRVGQLLERIAEPENLRLAYWKAAKGKRGKPDCRAVGERLDWNLDRLRTELLSGDVCVGDYYYFTIHDPKKRTICAANFGERVLHHALMNHCEPILERAAIYDSYACRKGKGRVAAIVRAQGYARGRGWFLKMDIRKYFDTIRHDVLRRLLGRKIKDCAVLGIFDRILASHETSEGRGLPIGNLTSQHFANFYLSPLDRYVKERLRCGCYVRYMDDFVVWGVCREELRDVRDGIKRFLEDVLGLVLKSNVALNRTALGMDFLGYRLFPDRTRLARRSKARFGRKFRWYESAYLTGQWSALVLQQRMQALLAFVRSAESWAFRTNVIGRFGVVANGLEPGDPRRQLEQQRQELPVGTALQQLAGQQEQQHRVPARSRPSSTCGSVELLVDPAAIPTCGECPTQAKKESTPSGVGRMTENSGRGFPPGELFPSKPD